MTYIYYKGKLRRVPMGAQEDERRSLRSGVYRIGSQRFQVLGGGSILRLRGNVPESTLENIEEVPEDRREEFERVQGTPGDLARRTRETRQEISDLPAGGGRQTAALTGRPPEIPASMATPTEEDARRQAEQSLEGKGVETEGEVDLVEAIDEGATRDELNDVGFRDDDVRRAFRVVDERAEREERERRDPGIPEGLERAPDGSLRVIEQREDDEEFDDELPTLADEELLRAEREGEALGERQRGSLIDRLISDGAAVESFDESGEAQFTVFPVDALATRAATPDQLADLGITVTEAMEREADAQRTGSLLFNLPIVTTTGAGTVRAFLRVQEAQQSVDELQRSIAATEALEGDTQFEREFTSFTQEQLDRAQERLANEQGNLERHIEEMDVDALENELRPGIQQLRDRLANDRLLLLSPPAVPGATEPRDPAQAARVQQDIDNLDRHLAGEGPLLPLQSQPGQQFAAEQFNSLFGTTPRQAASFVAETAALTLVGGPVLRGFAAGARGVARGAGAGARAAERSVARQVRVAGPGPLPEIGPAVRTILREERGALRVRTVERDPTITDAFEQLSAGARQQTFRQIGAAQREEALRGLDANSARVVGARIDAALTRARRQGRTLAQTWTDGDTQATLAGLRTQGASPATITRTQQRLAQLRQPIMAPVGGAPQTAQLTPAAQRSRALISQMRQNTLRRELEQLRATDTLGRTVALTPSQIDAIVAGAAAGTVLNTETIAATESEATPERRTETIVTDDDVPVEDGDQLPVDDIDEDAQDIAIEGEDDAIDEDSVIATTDDEDIEQDVDDDVDPVVDDDAEAVDDEDLEDEGDPSIAPADPAEDEAFDEDTDVVAGEEDESQDALAEEDEAAEREESRTQAVPAMSLAERVAAETAATTSLAEQTSTQTGTQLSLAEQVAAATAAQAAAQPQRRPGAGGAVEFLRQQETQRQQELRQQLGLLQQEETAPQTQQTTTTREVVQQETAAQRVPDAMRRRGLSPVVGFTLPDGRTLPEDTYPHKATWLQGFQEVTYDFVTDTETWRRSRVSGDPNSTFRVTSLTRVPPRDNNFQMGLFNVSLTSSGIRFSHPGATRDAMKPNASMPKPPRPRNPFGKRRM